MLCEGEELHKADFASSFIISKIYHLNHWEAFWFESNLCEICLLC